MFDYPSIGYNYENVIGRTCIISEKIDGHNVRAEYMKGKFYKLGSRKVLAATYDRVFDDATQMFYAKYADALVKILKKVQLSRAIVFGEVYGSKTHMQRIQYNEEMAWTFFDIYDIVHKCFLEPIKILKLLEGNVPIPSYRIEHVDRNVINEIREDDTPNREGVVFKPQRIRKPDHTLHYAKAKTKWFMREINEA